MKNKKKFIRYSLLALVAFVVLLIAFNFFAEHKIKQNLDVLFAENKGSYEEIHVNLLGRRIKISEPELEMPGESLRAEALDLRGIHIYKYLVDGDLVVNRVKLLRPSLKLRNEEQEEDESAPEEEEFAEDILIKSFELIEGDFSIAKEGAEEDAFFILVRELKLEEVSLNSETMARDLPFAFESYSFKGDSIFLGLDELHSISTGPMEIENDELFLKDLRLWSPYEKDEFQQYIPYEKDRFEISIEEIAMDDLQWKFEDDTIRLENPHTSISGFQLEAFRDKLQPDDERLKPMYSEMLRELPVKFSLDTLSLTDGYIRYEENLSTSRPPGVVDFHNVHASIYRLGNIGFKEPAFEKTKIDVQAMFMGEAELEVAWNLDVSDMEDHFTISGNMGRLSADGINKFFTPGLNVKARGAIDDMAFNFSGNHSSAKGDMDLKYEDFKVDVLQENGEERNSVISAITNFFMNNNAQNEDVHQENVTTKRDKTKSFWNFLWRFIRSGALDSFF